MTWRNCVVFISAFLFAQTGWCQSPSCYEYKDENLGSNTVYNLCEFNHCMYAATENGIVKIKHGKTTILRSPKAVTNSYTLFRKGQDGHLYTLNFRNQIYRITDNGLELFKDLRRDFPNPVKSYSFYQGYLYVNSEIALRRYHLNTLKEDTTWSLSNVRHEGQILNDTLFYDFLAIAGDSTIVSKDIPATLRSIVPNKNLLIRYLILRTTFGDFVCQYGKILSTNGFEFDYTQYLPNASNIHYFKQLDEKRIWLSTNAGAIILDTENPKNVDVLFPETSISDMFEDEQGKIWVATLGNGIKVVPDVGIKYFPSQQIISSFTTSVSDKRGFIGTETGAIYSLSDLKQPAFSASSKVNSLYEDTSSIYASSMTENLLFKNGKLHSTQPKPPKADRIFRVADVMVFSSWHGVLLTQLELSPYDPSKLSFNDVFHQIDGSLRLNKNLSPVWISPSLDKFLGLQNGNVKAHKSIRIPKELQRKDFADLRVYKNTPYLLTNAGEIWKYDNDIGKFSRLFEIKSNGLCQKMNVTDAGIFIYENGIIHRFIEDRYYAFAGLVRFKHEELIDFSVKSESVFVVFRNGVHEIPIASLSKQYPSNNLPLGLFINGKRLDPNHYGAVPPDAQSIVIHFNYFDEILSPETRFQYQINGNNWISTENRESLILNSLSPGTYTIKIKIEPPIGQPIYKTMTFEIIPKWYQTLWFNIGVSALIIVFMILLFLRRVKALQKRQRIENEIVQANMAKINAQMKPHFIFNVLTRIQSMILKEDRFEASNAIGEFAQFIRKTLEISRRESISLQQELEITEKYIQLEQGRQDNKFDYEINVLGLTSKAYQTEIPPLILQPYVENAIIHGLHHLSSRKGELVITIEEKANTLEFTVVDNGVGRQFRSGTKSKGEHHKSFANTANFDRVSLIKGSSVIIDDLDQGTRVNLIIPIKS